MKAAKILCPIDFSPCSSAAMQHAREIAETNGATLVLAHIVPPPPTYVSGFAGYGPMPPYQPEPDARLEQVALNCSQSRLERVHLVGVEGETIVHYAEEHGCDLIVMGTHGYGGLAKFFLGSVAEYVLRHAKPTVVVVRDKKAESVRASAADPAATPNYAAPPQFGPAAIG